MQKIGDLFPNLLHISPVKGQLSNKPLNSKLMMWCYAELNRHLDWLNSLASPFAGECIALIAQHENDLKISYFSFDFYSKTKEAA